MICENYLKICFILLANYFCTAKAQVCPSKPEKNKEGELIPSTCLYEKFKRDCKVNGGLVLGNKEICVPYENQFNMRNAPNPQEEEGSTQNKIEIEMFHVQIIEIDDKLRQMTLIMTLNIEWFDDRVKLVLPNVPLFLYKEGQTRVWSPEFIIGSNLVSQTKNGLKEDATLYGFEEDRKNNQTRGFSYSDFRATVFCKMDFTYFPFDKQSCEFKA